jgi:hypothetical protein
MHSLLPNPTHLHLYATAEAARHGPTLDPTRANATLGALTKLFTAPQYGKNGRPSRTVDHWTTRCLLRDQIAAHLAHDAHVEAALYGQTRALGRALSELRAAGITAGHIAQIPKPSPELATILAHLSQYENKLDAHHFTDIADRQRGALLQAATASLPQALSTIKTIVVEPGVEVFGFRRDLLRVLATRNIAVTVQVTHNVDYPSATPWAEAMVHGLETLTESNLQIAYHRPHTETPLAQIAARMAAQQSAPKPYPEAVTMVEVGAGEELVAHVVATVHRWLTAGALPQNIAIVLPPNHAARGPISPEMLGPRLVDALAAACIPAQPSAGPLLFLGRPARQIMAAFALATQVQSATSTKPPAWGEQGLALDVLAGLITWLGDDVQVDDTVLTAAAQGHLLRRCGSRRLGPQSLRRALRNLRGLKAPWAEATVFAAERFVSQWVLPLADGPGPLLPRVAHALHMLNQRHTKFPEEHGDHADLQAALRHLYRVLQSQPIETSLAEAQGWLAGLFTESRSKRTLGGPAALTLLAPSELPGRQFTHVLAVGMNAGQPVSPPDGALSEPVRRELNRALGPRLLQYGPVQGRGALPAAAKDLFYFDEMVRACSQTLYGLVVQTGDEEESEPSAPAQKLMDAAGVTLQVAAPSTAAPPSLQPSNAMARRSLITHWPWHLQVPPASTNATLHHLFRRVAHSRAQALAGHPRLAENAAVQLQQAILGHVHGTSSLDQLGTCRYRYFAGALMGLSGESHPEHHLDRRRQGEVAHRALFHIYTALAQGGTMAHWRREPEKAFALAKATVLAERAAILPDMWLHQDLRNGALAGAWEAGRSQLARDLYGESSEPVVLEYRFGDPARSPSPPLRANHPTRPEHWLEVRGSIDRVDQDGPHLRVIDYKSSLHPRPDGRHLQLGLYQAIALRDLVPAATSTDAIWQLLGTPTEGRDKIIPEGLRGTPQGVRDAVMATLWDRLDPVLQGDIAPDPAPLTSCRHCDFQRLCRFVPKVHQEDQNTSDAEDAADS